MATKEFKVRISWKAVMEDVLEKLKTNESAEVSIRSFSDYVGLRTAALKHELVVEKRGDKAIVSKQRSVTTVGVVGGKSTMQQLMATTPRLEWTREMEEAKFEEDKKNRPPEPEWYKPMARRPTKEAETCSFERAVEASDSQGRYQQLGFDETGSKIKDDCFSLEGEQSGTILDGTVTALFMAAVEFAQWEKFQAQDYLEQVMKVVEKKVLTFKTLHQAIDNALVNDEWFYAAMRFRLDKKFFAEWLEQNPGNAREFIELERPQQ